MTKKQMKELQSLPPLTRATTIYGVVGFGRLIGVTKGVVNIWRVRNRVPDGYHRLIEEKTEGQILSEEFYHHQMGMENTFRYCVKGRKANKMPVLWPLA